MKVQFTNGVLTVMTGVTVDVAKAAMGKPMKVTDKDGNVVFALTQVNTVNGQLSPFAIAANKVLDGELAYVELIPEGTTLEQVKAEYADALLAAHKYLPSIVENINKRNEELNIIWA